MKLRNVKEYNGGVRVGQTADGKNVIVRPKSSGGQSTIEIQNPNGSAEIKISPKNSRHSF